MSEKLNTGAQSEGVSIPTFEQLALREDLTGDEVVAVFAQHASLGKGVKVKEVIPLLEKAPLSYQQLGVLLQSCTEGLLRVKQKNSGWYEERMPQMSEYRGIRKFLQPRFDKEINKE